MDMGIIMTLKEELAEAKKGIAIFYSIDRRENEYDHTSYLVPDDMDNDGLYNFFESVHELKIEDVGFHLADNDDIAEYNINSISDVDVH